MSALLSSQEAYSRAQLATAAQLRAVPSSVARMSRIPFLLVLGLVLAVGMAGVLVLNVTIQGQASDLRGLQERATILGYQESALQASLDQLRSPTHLEQEAQKLGMRPNPHPVFIQLPQNEMLGDPAEVTGKEMPAQSFKTPAQVADEITAARAKVTADQKAKAEAAREAAAAKKAAAARQAAAEKKKQNAGGN